VGRGNQTRKAAADSDKITAGRLHRHITARWSGPTAAWRFSTDDHGEIDAGEPRRVRRLAAMMRITAAEHDRPALS
jgi:hypothetical protein